MFVEGMCLALSSGTPSNCLCPNLGCSEDPNDPSSGEKYVRCTEEGEKAEKFEGCTGDEIVNIETCSCESFVCPPCGQIPSDNSDCPSYVFQSFDYNFDSNLWKYFFL